jgi:acyl dehydratase
VGYVTDEHLALIDKPGPVQKASAPLTSEELRRFTQAVMESNPVHWDDEAARARGYDGVVAPPLFPVHASRRPAGTPDPPDRLRDDPDWDGASIDGGINGLPPLDMPLRRVLNGGNEARFYRLARVGDAISSESRYVSITEREARSGPMVFVVFETEYRNQDGDLLVSVRQTMIRR